MSSVAVNPATNKTYYTAGLSQVAAIDNANNTSFVSTPNPATSVVVNSFTNKTYVASSGANTVAVIDDTSNTTSVATKGDDPFSSAVDPLRNKIYITNFSPAHPNTVSVIDGASNNFTAIPVGQSPRFGSSQPADEQDLCSQ